MAGLSDVELLLLVLALIYLFECVCWLRPAAVCLSSALGWLRLRSSLNVSPRPGGRAAIASPFPWATTLVCEPWPVAISPLGICVWSESATGRLAADPPAWRWSEVQSIAFRDRTLLVNQTPAGDVSSTYSAQQLAQSLEELRAAGANPAGIDRRLATYTDGEAIMARATSLRRATRALRTNCTLFWIATFIVGPVLCYSSIVPWSGPVLSYLLACALLWLVTTIGSYFAHRALYPRLVSKRRGRVAALFASPATAIRSAEMLSHDALAGFHPLAVMAQLGTTRSVESFARQVLLDLRFPGPAATSNVVAGEISAWFRQQLNQQLEAAVRSVGVDVDRLLAPPHPDPDARSYCPRCHLQFREANAACQDCGGRVSESFS